MSIVNNYPYTDFHELNLDFILKRLDEYSKQVSTLEADAIKAATEAAREYVESRISELTREINALSARVTEMYGKFDSLTAYVNERVDVINARIDALRLELQNDINAVNIRTDRAIAYNNEYIFKTIDNDLATKVLITNFFTGEKVTLQEMFNYLANLHADNGVTISEFIGSNKTVNEIVAINESCTNWVVNGKNLLGI